MIKTWIPRFTRTGRALSLASFTICLFVSCLAFSKPSTPLKQILSYQEFTQLIMHNSARVPDLKKLWNWSEKNKQSEVYWAGGTLRGFLHWHYLQLQSHSVAEIRNMPVPSIPELQLLGGIDVDFVGPATAEAGASRALKGLAELDFIDSDTYSEYSKCGGPTIEKIGINPNKIMDPYEGFRHYYEGKIVFEWTNETEFRNFPWIKDGDFSKTTEALRFIRFGYYNLPELKPDAKSIKMIRKIADFEIPFMRQQDRLAWAGKALKKLIQSSHGNLAEVISLLYDYNLAPILIDAISSMPLETYELRAWSLETTHLEIESFLQLLKSPPAKSSSAGQCADLFAL